MGAWGLQEPEMRQGPWSGPWLGRDGMLLLLTAAAGSMDVASYLGLGQVFTAMMTGNTVLLGMALGQGHLLAALRSVLALLGFAAGVALAATRVLRDRPGDWSAAVTRVLALEGALLILFSLTWHLAGPTPEDPVVYALIAMAGVAMGLQSGAVHRLHVPGVMTTYITGTLTSLISDLTGRLGRIAGSAPGTAPQERRVGLLAAVFLVYALGALVEATLHRRWPTLMALLPVLAVWIVVANSSLCLGRGQRP
jgi:uncharacterized membrane protein YoaK (UPF0700 family)